MHGCVKKAMFERDVSSVCGAAHGVMVWCDSHAATSEKKMW